MKKKIQPPNKNDSTVNEPEAVYKAAPAIDRWNPNKPFHGTQEEWREHFQEIEKGEFSPVKETHERVSQWLKEQNK